MIHLDTENNYIIKVTKETENTIFSILKEMKVEWSSSGNIDNYKPTEDKYYLLLNYFLDKSRWLLIWHTERKSVEFFRKGDSCNNDDLFNQIIRNRKLNRVC